MQRKYGEYRELSSSLHVWIRENMAIMQDRQFPGTLIEVKKLAHESNEFRTKEVPPRLKEKTRVIRVFKEIEVIYTRPLLYSFSSSFLSSPPSYSIWQIFLLFFPFLTTNNNFHNQ